MQDHCVQDIYREMIDRESKWLGFVCILFNAVALFSVISVAKHTSWGVRFLLDFCCCYVHTIYSFMVMISTEKWALPLLVMLGIITEAIFPKRQTVGVTLLQPLSNCADAKNQKPLRELAVIWVICSWISKCFTYFAANPAWSRG